MNLATGQAHGQSAVDPVQPTKHNVYALVAAVGERFSFVYEVLNTGSHLDPYRRSSVAAGNLLNTLALQALDKAVAEIDPGSTRIYITFPAAQVEQVAPSQRESFAINKIISELQQMPHRAEWNRIVVATPAYTPFKVDGIATKLQGFGVFMQPLVGSSFTFDDNRVALVHGREDATTPDNKIVRSSTYVAPYSYIEIWVLDPKTLAVLDKQKRFENEKFADPASGSMDMSQVVSKKFLAAHVVGLIEGSIREAVMHSEVNSKHGEVEVSEPKVVNPDGARK